MDRPPRPTAKLGVEVAPALKSKPRLQRAPDPCRINEACAAGPVDTRKSRLHLGQRGPADFDGDGAVGILDLLALLANWGPCP